MSDLKRVPIDQIHQHPVLTPPRDETFLNLIQRAVAGEIHVYHAAVPLPLLQPFAADYDVESHPVGRAAVDQVVHDWTAGRFSFIWIYEQGNAFIVSDDYIVLAAARRGQPDYVPCWVFGKPIHPDVVDVQGPIAIAEVRRMLAGGENRVDSA